MGERKCETIELLETDEDEMKLIRWRKTYVKSERKEATAKLVR